MIDSSKLFIAIFSFLIFYWGFKGFKIRINKQEELKCQKKQQKTSCI